MKKLIINPDKTMFELQVNGRDYLLKASSLDSNWTKKGLKERNSLVNTGQGLRIKLGKKKINLDYCEAERLFLFLKEHSQGKYVEAIVQD